MWALSKDVSYTISLLKPQKIQYCKTVIARGGDNAQIIQYKLGTPGNSNTYTQLPPMVI